MTSSMDRPPKSRQRIEKAIRSKHRAKRMRMRADEMNRSDPLGARYMRSEAKDLETKADADLCRWNYTTGSTEIGNGNELVPLPEQVPSNREVIASFVRDRKDLLAHAASEQRMDLATEADALSLALDTSNDIEARTSIEKMIAHQAAEAHKLGMKLMTKAEQQLTQVQTWNPQSWSAHSVEAARLTNAAARIMGAFNEAMLTLQRLRTGGRQVMTVQHVQVNDGGKAIVAGTIKRGTKRKGVKAK